jgi:hypothetical protein
MAKMNDIYRDTVMDLVEEHKSLSRDADKANTVQYGTRSFSSNVEAAAWWDKLPAAKRQEYLQKNGNEAILKMLKGRKSGGGAR